MAEIISIFHRLDRVSAKSARKLLEIEMDLRGAEELAALAADPPAFAAFTADDSQLKVYLINPWLRALSQSDIVRAIERCIAAGYPEFTPEVIGEWRRPAPTEAT